MSTSGPKFDEDDFVSFRVNAPTQVASATRCGEVFFGSVLLPPAATVYETPDAIDLRTASSSAAEALPPNDMFATAGLTAFFVTQSMPAITPAIVPLPLSPSTLTPHT